jgi:hypothetical protein
MMTFGKVYVGCYQATGRDGTLWTVEYRSGRQPANRWELTAGEELVGRYRTLTQAKGWAEAADSVMAGR